MKNLFKATMFAAALFGTAQSFAGTPFQEHQTTGDKVKHTAKEVGHKTSNIAANGASRVVDKKYDGKYGPHGETVYINKNSHYYYINSKGHRVYVLKSHLMDKKM